MAISIALVHPARFAPLQTWLFESEASIRIGRATDNQVVLYSRVVSRYHLVLERLGMDWKMINLSTNGTYVRDQPISEACIQGTVLLHLAQSGPKLRIQLLSAPNQAHTRLEALPATFLAPLSRKQSQ